MFDYLEVLSTFAEVHLITLLDERTPDLLDEIHEVVHQVIAVPWSPALATRLAHSLGACLRSGRPRPLVNRRFVDTVNQAAARGGFDMLQADWTEVARWIRPPPGTPFVCGAHDLRSKVLSRAAALARGTRERTLARWRWRRAAEQEAALFRRANLILTLSRSDAAWVRESTGRNQTLAVVYRRALESATPPAWATRRQDQLLYVGDFGRPVNQRAAELLARDVLPRVRARHPAARLVLAGRRPPPELRSLAELPGVDVTGAIPDLAAVYRSSGVMVCPMDVGGGIHVKMVEAMSWGLPVVTTPVGNDGIAGSRGTSILVERFPDGMAHACSDLIDHPVKAERIGSAGCAHVRDTFGRERAERDVATALERALHPTPEPTSAA
jgi:glycosyltransferase involved in cell wall biosynthesis